MKRGVSIVTLVLLMCSLLVSPAFADRIICDPYPTGQSNTPDNTKTSKDGGATWITNPMETVTGGVRCNIPVTGDDYKTVKYAIKACQGEVLCSEASPFDPVLSIPGKPTGLRLSKD